MTKCYKGKDGDVQYTRTAKVDKKVKVSITVDRLLQKSARYLKQMVCRQHQPYITDT